MKQYNYKIIILFTLLYSCGGLSDLMLDMGSNFHYYGEGSSSNYIFFGKKSKEGVSIEKIIVKPSVEKYNFDEKFILVLQKPNLEWSAILLGGELTRIARTFKYMDSLGFEGIPKNLQDDYLSNVKDSVFFRKIGIKITPQNSIEEQRYFWRLADSIIKENEEYQKIFTNEVNYWIIEKETNKVFGPLSEQLYLNKKNELGVPQSLNL